MPRSATPARRGTRSAALLTALAAVATALAACSPPGQPGPRDPTYAELGRQALQTLEHGYYNGGGEWNVCVPHICGTGNVNWGVDSLTYALYFHWSLTHDRGVRPIMSALRGTAVSYSPAVHTSSDVPVWDTIADVREYQVTRDVAALAKAEAAFRFVADGRSRFALGACPAVNYQQPGGGGTRLKTLETGSNYIKAALLLYQVTRFPGYLRDAVTEYAAVRRYFLSPGVPLYTVYVFDNGSACTQVPGRYFGSVNGNMIWAGLYLARATGDASYLGQAAATARAVARHLGDATGVYADLQAENDVTEPLIEAMYDMATAGRQGFARHWLLAAASAAASGRTASGTYGRFFGGPPPRAPVTAWQVNGGLTLALAAAALDPRGRPTPDSGARPPSSAMTCTCPPAPSGSPSPDARSRSSAPSGRSAASPATPRSSSTGPGPTIRPASGRTSPAPGGACRTRCCSPGAGLHRGGTPSRSGPASRTPRKAARSST